MTLFPHQVVISLPDWVEPMADWTVPLGDDEAKVEVAIRLAVDNVERGSGGPFGALVCRQDTGEVVGIGVNQVMSQSNSLLHAEIMAVMVAQERLGSHVLNHPGHPPFELVSSCDPCAMCLGAAQWSGVKRIVASAMREDAAAIGFDEGPVFEASWQYLRNRGIEVLRGVKRKEGAAVLERYRDQGGIIYNG